VARKAREPQERVFAGSPTTDRDALHRALIHATRADVTVGGYLVFAVDPADDVLDDAAPKRVSVRRRGATTSTTGPDDLVALFRALRVGEITDFLCLCTGDYVIEFYDGRNEVVEVVRVDLPSSIESRHWAGAAELAEPARLAAWLVSHGFEPH